MPPTQRRPGGRSARIHDLVTDAALAQLLALGPTGLTLRGVARAAGVAETTVYRRWPTTDHLMAAALLRLAERDNPLPDTGTLAGDLDALLHQIVSLLRRPEVLRIARGAATLDDSVDSVAEAKSAFFGRRFANARIIVERAIERGELPADTDPDPLIENLVAPAYMRALLGNRPLDDDLVDNSVRFTIAAHRRPPNPSP